MGHPCAGQAHRQSGTPHHIGVLAILVLVYLGKAALDVPEGDQAYAGSGCNLGMVLVFEDPVNLSTSIAQDFCLRASLEVEKSKPMTVV